MKKIDLILGLLLGFLTTFIGVFLYIELVTDFNLIQDFLVLKTNGLLGKIITLGAVLNLIVFFILLKKNKELMARGIVLATIILTILTLFI